MADKKKVRVKVKKRKIKVKRLIIFALIIILVILSFLLIRRLPTKNIYIIGTNIISDKEIIKSANLEDYPPFFQVSKRDIREKILAIPYVKEVQVKKKFYNKIYISITEHKVLCSYNDKLLLESGEEVANTHHINSVPILISDITTIKERFAKSFSKVDNDILLKISQITYTPNDVDEERFALQMNDGNLVYITLGKITKLNKYNSIYSRMEGKEGIIYLDSGDYVELK